MKVNVISRMISKNKKSTLKIDFGSGYNPKSGYKTCDITNAPFLDFAYDGEKIIGCKKNSVDEFYLRNVIHHIPNLKEVFLMFHFYLKRNGKIRLYTALINTRINEVNDLIWEVEFPNGLTSFNQKILEDVNNKNELIKEILKITGKEVHLRYKDLKNVSQAKENRPSSPISDLGIDINIID